MKLIIIESPNKIHAFKEALSKEYEILASVGHVLDLPRKSFSVDLKTFEATFEVIPEKKEILDNIKQKSKKADIIYLMTDCDREGWGISSAIYNEIKDITKATILRAETSEITKKGILNGIHNAIPMNSTSGKYYSFLARRLLDRTAGYKMSWPVQMATGGKSAGRVQSAILRVLVDREKEIISFKPEEYWTVIAYLLSSKKEPFYATLSDTVKITNIKDAQKIYDTISKGTPVVSDIEKKETNINASPPFVTMHLIASASSVYGWGADKTMNVAQDLFSAGHISYHRTDCFDTPADVLSSVRSFIPTEYGNKYLPDKANYYASKKGSQEAHSCIYPTGINKTNPSLSGDELKLYTLIWKRFVASQMVPGRDEKIKVITKISNYDFISRGSRVLFDGFRKCWDFSSSEDVILPALVKGEKCSWDKSPSKTYEKKSITSFPGLVSEQKFTSPPSRYSDASLAKKCENEQIARPATFGNFVKLLQDRGYMTREKKAFKPTELGIRVIDFLVAADVCFADLKFTAALEEKLDLIQEGKLDKLTVLSEFWERLKQDLEKGKSIKAQNEITEYKCPLCSGALLKKNSAWGSFYSCSNYKKPKKVKGKEVPQEGSCSYKANIGTDGQPVEKEKKVIEYANFKCKQCGSKMVKRKSSWGEFCGCEKYPACKTTASLDGVFKENSGKKKFKKYWKKK